MWPVGALVANLLGTQVSLNLPDSLNAIIASVIIFDQEGSDAIIHDPSSWTAIIHGQRSLDAIMYG